MWTAILKKEILNQNHSIKTSAKKKDRVLRLIQSHITTCRMQTSICNVLRQIGDSWDLS